MNILDLIEKKRDGLGLSDTEIKFMIDGYVAGRIPDYQISALLMAIYLKGMSFEESAWLTGAMLNSGERIHLDAIPGIKVDKHSTGGVGDKVSLILAPMIAALGVPIPMMSGRGLGHSGGTLDKLESIPGFNHALSVADFQREISEIGVSLIGQTDTLVPADKKIYALRDSTGTVNSIPLVTASIMSKKIAEGANALVLDVKFGRGAFFKNENEAIELAQRLIAIGQQYDLPTVALLTAMNQPLGMAVGNWLEIKECIDALKGNGPKDLMEVTYALGAQMLLLGKKVTHVAAGIAQCKAAIQSGNAFRKFLKIVEWQGGDVSVIQQPEKYPKARYALTIKTKKEGYIKTVDAWRVGKLSMFLGAGRAKKEDAIDFTAGILLKKKQGDFILSGETLAIAYSGEKDRLIDAQQEIGNAFEIGDQLPEKEKLIVKLIDKDGVKDWEYQI
jgi:pyrimidine-nucleoside phosphorylase